MLDEYLFLHKKCIYDYGCYAENKGHNCGLVCKIIAELKGEYMEERRDIFQIIKEIGENGKIKASCCLMVEKGLGDVDMTPKIHKLAYMQNASVIVRLIGNFAVVDLSFEDCADYDYLRALELCREFTDMTDACEYEEKTNSDHSLILYMTPNGKYDFFLLGMDAAWKLIPKKLKERRNAIRMIFTRENFGTYELS